MSTEQPRRGNAALVLWGTISTRHVDEDELNDWWTNEHLPERLRLPGFLRARRYRALSSSSPQHADSDEAAHADSNANCYLAWYEVEDVANLCSEAYMQKLEHPTLRTAQSMPALSGMTRCACKMLGSFPPVGDELWAHMPRFMGLLLVTLRVPSAIPSTAETGSEETFLRRVEDVLCASVGLEKGENGYGRGNGIAIGLHIAQVDEGVTAKGSATASYEDVKFDAASNERGGQLEGSRFIVLVEFDIRPPLQPTKCVEDALRRMIVEMMERRGSREDMELAWWAFEGICEMRKEAVEIQ